METLAITHHHPGDRARILIVNKFETRSMRALRRRNRPARASAYGAVVIGCSTDSGDQWHTALTGRGIAFRRSDQPGDFGQDVSVTKLEDLA